METIDGTYEKLVNGLTDCQLIEVISAVQGYTHEQTYVYAHKQVGVIGDPWNKWSRNFSLMPTNTAKLPTPVRIELDEAILKILLHGRLKQKHFAKVLEATMSYENRQNMFKPPQRSFFDKIFNYMLWFLIFYWIFSIFL